MAVENEGGILDEDGVRVISKLRQAHDRVPGSGEGVLISLVLSRSPLGVDRRALEVGELALGEPRADRAGVGFRHLALVLPGDDAALHHDEDVADSGHIARWVAADNDKIGEQARA